ncbi:MAG: transketolase [Candidatus Muiribacteriota bacterium]
MEKAINTIRALSVDCINKANSGHPGLPMGAAPMAYVLWKDIMRHCGENPQWIGRDRFVLSAGHGSALIYTLLHFFGYGLTIDDLKNFRQWGSKTPGHPEFGHTTGVETTTGPLGQGFANAVGMEIAREYISAKFDKNDIKLFDNFTYVIMGDGCIMEGVTAEAASLAGHLKLKNLIALYDDNNITIEGNTSLALSEDVKKRFEAYGWDVFTVEDGNNTEDIKNTIIKARNSEKPALVKIKTVIGYGSPNKAGTSEVHGSPLGEKEALLAKQNLGLTNTEPFNVDEDVMEHFENVRKNLKNNMIEWNKKLEKYKTEYGQDYIELNKIIDGFYDNLPFNQELLNFDKDSYATREAGGIVLNKLADLMPNFIGGSADLAPSTKTFLNKFKSFSSDIRDGRNIHFGIREHAMGSIVNGIVLYLNKKFKAYGSTFLVFSDYMKGALRLSSLMNIPAVNIFTHDSIGVGEDGPTHQPVEHLASLRMIPGMFVVRPADARETAYLMHKFFTDSKPVCFALSRQKLPVLKQVDERCLKGGYVLSDTEKLNAVIIATGSEVEQALKAQKILSEKNINVRVVSMPCREIFESQPEKYRTEVIPSNLPVFVVEAGVSSGWEKYFSPDGASVCIDSFGASAPDKKVLEEFGFNSQNIAEVIIKKLNETRMKRE